MLASPWLRWTGDDVDHPAGAEPVDAHAERRPREPLERHRDGAALAQALPVAAQSGLVVAAERYGDTGLGPVLHTLGCVCAHEHETVGGLQLGVHDLVLLGRIGAGGSQRTSKR